MTAFGQKFATIISSLAFASLAPAQARTLLPVAAVEQGTAEVTQNGGQHYILAVLGPAFTGLAGINLPSYGSFKQGASVNVANFTKLTFEYTALRSATANISIVVQDSNTGLYYISDGTSEFRFPIFTFTSGSFTPSLPAKNLIKAAAIVFHGGFGNRPLAIRAGEIKLYDTKGVALGPFGQAFLTRAEKKFNFEP